MQEEICWVTFSRFDENNNGSIMKSSLARALEVSELRAAIGEQAFSELSMCADRNDGDYPIQFVDVLSVVRQSSAEMVRNSQNVCTSTVDTRFVRACASGGSDRRLLQDL